MGFLIRFLSVFLAMQVVQVAGVSAAEEIGKAVAITVTVSGSSGPLSISSPVHRDERIQASSSGTGQFVFRDGTKLAVGPNSSLALDQSIFNDQSSFKSFSLKTSKGAFRWISGSSKSSAYRINTPFGTLGIRGTAFDFYVNGRSATIILLKGQARFCGNDGSCKSLSRGCDVVSADRSGVKQLGKTEAKTPVNGVGNAVSFPFLTGSRKLTQPFRVAGGSCGLTTVRVLQEERSGSRPDGGSPGGGTGGTSGSSGGNSNGPT